jgi:uncharacterized protein (TIGR02246 family)
MAPSGGATEEVAMAATGTTTREAIVALFARREVAWRARDAAALAADHAPEGVVVSPTGGVLEGRGEIERIYRVWFSAFPDLSLTVEDLIIDDGSRTASSRTSAGSWISPGCSCRWACCEQSPPAGVNGGEGGNGSSKRSNEDNGGNGGNGGEALRAALVS